VRSRTDIALSRPSDRWFLPRNGSAHRATMRGLQKPEPVLVAPSEEQPEPSEPQEEERLAAIRQAFS
jgi:hypothetical protein